MTGDGWVRCCCDRIRHSSHRPTENRWPSHCTHTMDFPCGTCEGCKNQVLCGDNCFLCKQRNAEEELSDADLTRIQRKWEEGERCVFRPCRDFSDDTLAEYRTHIGRLFSGRVKMPTFLHKLYGKGGMVESRLRYRAALPISVDVNEYSANMPKTSMKRKFGHIRGLLPPRKRTIWLKSTLLSGYVPSKDPRSDLPPSLTTESSPGQSSEDERRIEVPSSEGDSEGEKPVTFSPHRTPPPSPGQKPSIKPKPTYPKPAPYIDTLEETKEQRSTLSPRRSNAFSSSEETSVFVPTTPERNLINLPLDDANVPVIRRALPMDKTYPKTLDAFECTETHASTVPGPIHIDFEEINLTPCFLKIRQGRKPLNERRARAAGVLVAVLPGYICNTAVRLLSDDALQQDYVTRTAVRVKKEKSDQGPPSAGNQATQASSASAAPGPEQSAGSASSLKNSATTNANGTGGQSGQVERSVPISAATTTCGDQGSVGSRKNALGRQLSPLDKEKHFTIIQSAEPTPWVVGRASAVGGGGDTAVFHSRIDPCLTSKTVAESCRLSPTCVIRDSVNGENSQSGAVTGRLGTETQSETKRRKKKKFQWEAGNDKWKTTLGIMYSN